MHCKARLCIPALSVCSNPGNILPQVQLMQLAQQQQQQQQHNSCRHEGTAIKCRGVRSVRKQVNKNGPVCPGSWLRCTSPSAGPCSPRSPHSCGSSSCNHQHIISCIIDLHPDLDHMRTIRMRYSWYACYTGTFTDTHSGMYVPDPRESKRV